MDSKDINRFSIREYLAGMNIHPAKDKNSYGIITLHSERTKMPA